MTQNKKQTSFIKQISLFIKQISLIELYGMGLLTMIVGTALSDEYFWFFAFLSIAILLIFVFIQPTEEEDEQ